jgi:hypothetical protein
MGEETFTQRTVTAVMAVIALLAFVFSFGNVWALALRLGVPRPVAPLIAPMVDLSVVGLLVALRYLSLHGVPAEELRAGTRLMHLCGALTLGLNIADPLTLGLWGRAAVDSVAPLLLLGWGHVGPQFLRQFHALTAFVPVEAAIPLPSTTSDAPAAPPPVALPVPVTGTAVAAHVPPVPAALLKVARSIADKHHADQGEPITPGQLKARLGVTLPLATAALEQLSV